MKWLVVTLVLGIVGCGGEKKSTPGAGSGSGSARGQEPPPAAGGLRIFVDDVAVGWLAGDQIALWPRVDTLVPVAARRLGTWEAIKLTGAGPTPVTIAKPSAAYPELVPAIFPDDSGKAAFGMFDPVELAKHGQPALRENAVSEIRIEITKGGGRGENEHGEGGGGDPAQLELTIKTKDGDKVIEGSKLIDMPREAPPGGAGEGKGWKLSVILAQAGVTKYERLLLADTKGTNLTLETQDVDEKAAIPFVKLNRQGTLRFRVYRKQGDTWQPGSDLRGLASVEILK
jgi:hypothetical protein